MGNHFNGIDHAADTVLVDAINAVVSYYSINSNRVGMKEIWNGGSNIINSINPGAASSLSSGAGSSAAPGSNSGKIQKGIKLCGSLLRWCKRMQLNSIYVTCFSHQYHGNPSSSSKSKSSKMSSDNNETYLYFITQVMRFVSAKWRETDECRIKKKKKKKKRK